MDEEVKNSEEKNEPVEETVIDATSQKDTKEEKNKFSEEAKKIKDETKETVNTVKEKIKNTNFKKDANETTSFVKEMFFNPFEAVKRAADGENILGKVIILMIVFVAATVLQTIMTLFKVGSFFGFGHNVLRFIFSFLKPVIMVVVPSIVIWIFSGENRKKLITIISTVVVSYIPIIVNTILLMLTTVITELSLVTNPLSIALSAVSTILMYFGFKELTGKSEDESVLGKFAIVLFVSEIILLILTKFGIY